MFGFGRRPDRPEPPRRQAVAVSETGLVRGNNEDNFLVAAADGVYAVADGMGGGEEGERASALVCANLKMLAFAAETDFTARLETVVRAVAEANRAIHDYATARGFRQMGSTVAALVFDPSDPARAATVHVGDSRVYRIRGGMATALTRDHSVGFELGDFAGCEAERFRDRANPLAHVLTRAVGALPEVRCEIRETDVRPGDRFLLCTDGLHDVVPDGRIAVFAAGGTLATARDRLAAEIVKRGAPDNYTFILVG